MEVGWKASVCWPAEIIKQHESFITSWLKGNERRLCEAVLFCFFPPGVILGTSGCWFIKAVQRYRCITTHTQIQTECWCAANQSATTFALHFTSKVLLRVTERVPAAGATVSQRKATAVVILLLPSECVQVSLCSADSRVARGKSNRKSFTGETKHSVCFWLNCKAKAFLDELAHECSIRFSRIVFCSRNGKKRKTSGTGHCWTNRNLLGQMQSESFQQVVKRWNWRCASRCWP